jgi:drug/metabolite transporter (DMT)-like permease
VIAILGGFGAALCWAAAILASSRSSRLIGAWSTLAWVMIVGCGVALPAVVLTGPVELDGGQIGLIATSGVMNVAGLLCAYTALRRGKVAVVAPIISTEGAIAALISVAAGEPIAAGAAVVLALIVIGVILATTERREPPVREAGVEPVPLPSVLVTALFAIGAATAFGINLYAGARIAGMLPVAWALVPARLAGLIGVALPLLLTRRLRLTRQAAPFVVIVGLAEVIGTASFAFGSRDGIAIASVVSSQFAAVAVVAAFILFRERLTRLQLIGVVTIAVGVAVLSYLTA